VLVAFTAGLFVRSFKIKKDAASFLEDKVLNKLPPYVALRKYTDRLAGLEAKTNEDLKPVLVRMQNGWQLGFLADAFNDGQVAVFMPGSPDLRREWCRLSAPTTSPLSIFPTETHSRASSSLGAGFQSSWQERPLKIRGMNDRASCVNGLCRRSLRLDLDGPLRGPRVPPMVQ